MKWLQDLIANPAKYRKAIAGFLAPIVTLAGALLALGVLPDPWSHDLAVVLAVLTPIAGFFGVAVAPANAAPEPPPPPST